MPQDEKSLGAKTRFPAEMDSLSNLAKGYLLVFKGEDFLIPAFNPETYLPAPCSAHQLEIFRSDMIDTPKASPGNSEVEADETFA